MFLFKILILKTKNNFTSNSLKLKRSLGSFYKHLFKKSLHSLDIFKSLEKLGGSFYIITKHNSIIGLSG